MKNVRLSLVALGIAATSLFAFSRFEPGSIKGSVSPAEFAVKAWAISANDTIQVKVDHGEFELKDAMEVNEAIIQIRDTLAQKG